MYVVEVVGRCSLETAPRISPKDLLDSYSSCPSCPPVQRQANTKPFHMKTIAEKILSMKSGRDVRAGDTVVCTVDWVLGTDASSPMAIDYFRQMGGDRVVNPDRVLFAMDHYSPPSTAKTAAFHEEIRVFARRFGTRLREVGDGISFQ